MENTLVRLTISQSELFANWPDAAISRLVKAADAITVEENTVIHRTGEVPTYLYLLATGSMHLIRKMPSGRDFTAGIHLAGEFHGIGPVITRSLHFYTAECREKTVLVRISGELLREMISHDGSLAYSLMGAMVNRHRGALDRYEGAAVLSTRARVATLLNSIYTRSARGGRVSSINLSQEEIATMLGTRRQVVNRVLREMESEGAVQVLYGRIVISDIGKLEKMAEHSE
ncbi:cAMP-binding domain of CRP or a regulatory subunit of cAMP-dependent protein kinases [Collimonas sp. OK307]|uniref:Crp/Fnr family transcriptional regulator n=1 Tax=Collimonas sp. OK307 TaxID=1801620 RepID=UPI0008F12C20|nr:Crp/Fnr family transcriptional regulator [Collimonas sp. OK307]SFI34733.1 cAMP-binding domain of CRP or a regulatory subunit of cAMP-dependent protein kinases [Collimonas sp. OK307]